MVRLKTAYWESDFEAVCPTLDHDLLTQAHIISQRTSPDKLPDTQIFASFTTQPQYKSHDKEKKQQLQAHHLNCL